MADANDQGRAQAILRHALGLAAGERDRYLEETCGQDTELRRRVEALIADDGGETHWSLASSPMPTVPGYRLLRKLGEGGMGEVFLAEQLEPIRRRVALKLVKPGLDSTTILARFEAERQALALMNHPNVACVFDAGSTQDGRPYFVMEYVDGMPLTEFCDVQRLGTRNRLGLFIAACEGIHHAHQKGVIHRDIKPSNILVAMVGGIPCVKVIDFGVAKATSLPLTEKTLFTQAGALVGTPAYMSPEQAGLTAAGVDTRSDIYSLGVVMYELLSGVPPFRAEMLRTLALHEVLRVLREEDPDRPSARVSTLGREAEETARLRRTDLRGLKNELSGDLDWITMKALEKEPGRRYASASEFATDVGRHLADELVSAGSPSLAYRARKLVRRHRLATMLTLVVGLALSLLVLVETNNFYRFSGFLGSRVEATFTENYSYRALASQLGQVIGRSLLSASDAATSADELDHSASARFARTLVKEFPGLRRVVALDTSGGIRFVAERPGAIPAEGNAPPWDRSREVVVPIRSQQGSEVGTLVLSVDERLASNLEGKRLLDKLYSPASPLAQAPIQVELLVVAGFLAALVVSMWWMRRP